MSPADMHHKVCFSAVADNLTPFTENTSRKPHEKRFFPGKLQFLQGISANLLYGWIRIGTDCRDLRTGRTSRTGRTMARKTGSGRAGSCQWSGFFFFFRLKNPDSMLHYISGSRQNWLRIRIILKTATSECIFCIVERIVPPASVFFSLQTASTSFMIPAILRSLSGSD